MTETLIPGYDIISVLGRGDTATVYHAVFSAHQPVALKILDGRLSSDPNFIQHFRQDLKHAAALVHPNIGRVYACGSTGSEPYIATELVEGESLRTLLRRRVMTVEEAVSVVDGVGAALDHAHEKGMLHRDVKPGNILLREDGGVLLVDFGLARCTRLAALTSPNLSLRRAPYVAPEVCQGREPDRRSDLYSLGIVLFEMLTGKPPFDGFEPMAIYAQHVKRTPPALRSTLPRRLQRVIEKVLAKDPSRRYQSGEELARDVAAACGVTVAPRSQAQPSLTDAEAAPPVPTAEPRDPAPRAPAGSGAARAVSRATFRLLGLPLTAATAASTAISRGARSITVKAQERSTARRAERELARSEKDRLATEAAAERAEEARLRAAREERARVEKENFAAEQRREVERIRAEKARVAAERAEEARLRAAEEERVRVEQENLAADRRRAEEEARRERERLAEAKRAEEARVAEERRREAARAAELKAAELKAAELKAAEVKAAEAARVAEERRVEELRLAEENRAEEARIAEEHRREEARQAELREKEEARLAEKRRLEQEREAKRKAREEARRAEERRRAEAQQAALRTKEAARQAEVQAKEAARQAEVKATAEASATQERRRLQEAREREREAVLAAKQAARAAAKLPEPVAEPVRAARRPLGALAAAAAGVAALAAFVYLNRPPAPTRNQAPGPQAVRPLAAAVPDIAATSAADLRKRFAAYLDRFEAYHRTRLQLGRPERHARLTSFRGEINGILAQLRELPDPVPELESGLYREIGTLEWFQAHPDTARAQWRRALSVDSKNSLAGDWLRETKGAVLNE